MPRKKDKKKRKIQKIDQLKPSAWFLMIFLYALFIAILSGAVVTQFEKIVYIGPIPLDIQTAVFVFGVALWIPISMVYKSRFKK